ncbi:MAG: bifunctional UDP-sugar hydrolase/5'-nucleotidase [Deltaproteobacteria bacterium]|nr:bifunctional UDP-sugar hydrolase/5'-nucleotidase [Deltaproteobacteria bacterium]
MNRTMLWAAVLALTGTGCLIKQEQPALEDQDVALTILHTSDIHSRLLPYDLQPLTTDRNLGLAEQAPPYGGIGRLSALLKRERAKSYRAIHLDSGDCFQGAPIFNENLGEVEIRWLSQVHADGVVIGNHEFDAGAWNLYYQAAAHATYPLLAANYDFRDPQKEGVVPLGEVSQPYTIINARGLKVAVIGMANISSLNSIVAEGNSTGAMPLEQNEALRGWVDFLLPQVDVITVTSHLGLHEDVELVTGYERTFAHEEARLFVQREDQPWHLVEDLGDGTGTYFIPGVRGLDVIMGGHLHVVLSPPQVIVDLDGREVVLAHSGAFAKYLGRLDLVLRTDPDHPERGHEVAAHTYKAFPLDGIWCLEDRPAYNPLDPGPYLEMIENFAPQCARREDAQTNRMLAPYILGLNNSLDLPAIFAYAPRVIQRRNSSSGGDAPLGNLTADAMRRRKRVDAEIAITNTLGIRDAIYAGPVNVETMFNVFPFENTITVMYLSGTEVQELLDYVGSRSAGRGCQSQAQIAGVRFVMDCGQVLANEHEYECQQPSDCPNFDPTDTDGIPWQCVDNRCWAHSAKDIMINGQPLQESYSYKMATNNYIAQGGSGFRMLKRNTTQFDTGISLRDGLVEKMRNFCTCNELLAAVAASPDGTVERCNGQVVDLVAIRTCEAIRDAPEAASAGKCSCGEVQEALNAGVRDNQNCGHITDSMKAFCEAPLSVPVLVGVEDGRIERRVIDRSLQ